MKTLDRLERERYLKIYNLMPDDLGKKEMPAFFIQDKDTNI